jgi:hypothetical protein
LGIFKEIDEMTGELTYYKQSLNLLIDKELSNVNTLADLKSIISQVTSINEEIDYDKISQSLITLGEKYSNTTNEISRYQEALNDGDTIRI